MQKNRQHALSKNKKGVTLRRITPFYLLFSIIYYYQIPSDLRTASTFFSASALALT